MGSHGFTCGLEATSMPRPGLLELDLRTDPVLVALLVALLKRSRIQLPTSGRRVVRRKVLPLRGPGPSERVQEASVRLLELISPEPARAPKQPNTDQAATFRC